jgi:hypothetical protein
MLDRGVADPEGEMLFSRQAFRDALPVVSQTRLEKTLYAEYANLRPQLVALHSEKTNQSLRTLSRVWGVNEEQARTLAEQLVEIGFFERRGDKDDPAYWVPFLYRPALAMVQGSAEPGMADQE